MDKISKIDSSWHPLAKQLAERNLLKQDQKKQELVRLRDKSNDRFGDRMERTLFNMRKSQHVRKYY